MSRKFKRNLLFGFGASLFILLISSAASFISIQNLLKNANLVNRTNAVIRNVNEFNAALVDAETGLSHALALHNKKVQLNRELKAAEAALGEDPSEETFERLRDIKNQITTVDGTEALIEGFGSLSGRATRSF